MMRLLKYDWKRNAGVLLPAALVFVVVELIAELAITSDALAMFLLVIGYVGIFIMIFIATIKTYSQNIASYSRRLLPVGPLAHIFSPMVFGLAAEFILGLVFLLHNWFRQLAGETSLIDVVQSPLSVGNTTLDWSTVISTAVAALWTVFVVKIVFFAAITIGRSVYIKAWVWVTVISYLVLENGFGLLQSALGLQEFPWLTNNISRITYWGQPNADMQLVAQPQVWGAFAFEAIFSLVMIVMIVILLNRRVEVK